MIFQTQDVASDSLTMSVTNGEPVFQLPYTSHVMIYYMRAVTVLLDGGTHQVESKQTVKVGTALFSRTLKDRSIHHLPLCFKALFLLKFPNLTP